MLSQSWQQRLQLDTAPWEHRAIYECLCVVWFNMLFGMSAPAQSPRTSCWLLRTPPVTVGLSESHQLGFSAPAYTKASLYILICTWLPVTMVWLLGSLLAEDMMYEPTKLP